MKRAFYITGVLGVLYILMTIYAHAFPSWASIIVVLLAFVALVVMSVLELVAGYSTWRHVSRLWMMPGLLSLAFLLCSEASAPVGSRIADWQFKRRLPQYTAVVNEFKEGVVSCITPCRGTLGVLQAPSPPRGIRALRGARCDDGNVVIAFLLDTRVPLLHEGYIFNGMKEQQKCNGGSLEPEKNWQYVRRVVGDWYHFSDEQGL